MRDETARYYNACVEAAAQDAVSFSVGGSLGHSPHPSLLTSPRVSGRGTHLAAWF